MRQTALLVVLLLGCARTRGDEPDQLDRLKVPRGFHEMKAGLESLPTGSYVFVEDVRATVENAFLGSITVQPINSHEIVLSDAFCQSAGEVFAKRTQTTLASSTFVRGACEIHARANDRPEIETTYVVFHGRISWWGATCTADTRDDLGSAACGSMR